MSEYVNRHRCMICRSKKNYDSYKGDFEVTALLNTLYLTIMHIIEKDGWKKIVPWSKIAVQQLKANNIVLYEQENNFNEVKILKCLRNGLAHLNIETENEDLPSKEKGIKNIIIFDKHIIYGSKCKSPCKARKCVSKVPVINRGCKYKSICKFTFSFDQLEKFTYSAIKFVLKRIPETKHCKVCVNKQSKPASKQQAAEVVNP